MKFNEVHFQSPHSPYKAKYYEYIGVLTGHTLIYLDPFLVSKDYGMISYKSSGLTNR